MGTADRVGVLVSQNGAADGVEGGPGGQGSSYRSSSVISRLWRGTKGKRARDEH